MYAQIVDWKQAGMSQLQLKMFHQSDSSRFALKPKFSNIITTVSSITITTLSRYHHQYHRDAMHPTALHFTAMHFHPNPNRFRNIQNYKHLYWCMHKCRRKFVSLTANFPSVHICYYPWIHLQWDSLPVIFCLYLYLSPSACMFPILISPISDLDGIQETRNFEQWIISMRYLRDNIHHNTTIV